MEALAVIAKEFAMNDVGRLVPRMVQGGEVQLPQQLCFVSARDGEPVAVFAAALQNNACLLKKRANAPERIIQIRRGLTAGLPHTDLHHDIYNDIIRLKKLSFINCAEAAVVWGTWTVHLSLPIDDHVASVEVVVLGVERHVCTRMRGSER